MKLIVDENIPFGKETFSQLGSVTVLPGRQIAPHHLQDATALIVRSVTQVNEALLAGSKIQFVGTATAGVDHIDLPYLTEHDIGFADAAGSNANSVAEYVLTALVTVSQQKGISLQGKTLGIIGVGRIGSLVEKKARALGMNTILNDPPLERQNGETCYRPLKEALQADFLTLHVPLTKEGIDKTYHLIGESELRHLPSSSVVMNTSRGEVVDNIALLRALEFKRIQGAVLDVWEGEPSLNWELVHRVNIATPHIAGYSFDGKINGTKMIYQALCQFLGKDPTWKVRTEKDDALSHAISLNAQVKDFQALVFQLASTLYDLKGDHARMRALINLRDSERPTGFDLLRKNYPIRREFFASPISLQNADPIWISRLTDIGFSVLSD